MANETTKLRAAESDVSAAPVPDAAARFEVFTGDLLRRIELACDRVAPLGTTLEPFGVIEAARRLKNALAEHKHEIAEPLGTNTARLIERQGERIRALTTELESALEGARKKEAALLAEVEAWTMRHKAATVRAESAEELAAWKKLCARCNQPEHKHRDGACPEKSAGREVSALRCVKCDGVVERAEVAGARVWFCPACAWRANDEAAGVRGTGE